MEKVLVIIRNLYYFSQCYFICFLLLICILFQLILAIFSQFKEKHFTLEQTETSLAKENRKKRILGRKRTSEQALVVVPLLSAVNQRHESPFFCTKKYALQSIFISRAPLSPLTEFSIFFLDVTTRKSDFASRQRHLVARMAIL